MLKATATLKFTEQDIYSDGCQPDTARTEVLNWGGGSVHTYTAPTLGLLLNKIKAALDVTADDLLLDSCDEPGRLDVQRMEDNNGDALTADELKQWKMGKFNAFLACYTFEVVSTAPLSARKTAHLRSGLYRAMTACVIRVELYGRM